MDIKTFCQYINLNNEKTLPVCLKPIVSKPIYQSKSAAYMLLQKHNHETLIKYVLKQNVTSGNNLNYI